MGTYKITECDKICKTYNLAYIILLCHSNNYNKKCESVDSFKIFHLGFVEVMNHSSIINLIKERIASINFKNSKILCNDNVSLFKCFQKVKHNWQRTQNIFVKIKPNVVNLSDPDTMYNCTDTVCQDKCISCILTIDWAKPLDKTIYI